MSSADAFASSLSPGTVDDLVLLNGGLIRSLGPNAKSVEGDGIPSMRTALLC